MCDTSAYIVKEGKEELVMNSLELMKVHNGSLEITNIFGERKNVEGRIRELNFLENKVLIEV